MRKNFFKLVRDNIINIMQFEGIDPLKINYEILNDDDAYLTALKAKLIEEAIEVRNTTDTQHLIEELADVQEVLEAIETLINKQQGQLNSIRNAKIAKKVSKGSFYKRIFLNYIDD